MKRVFSLILTIFMILTILPFPVSAYGNSEITPSETHLLTIHNNTPVYNNVPGNNLVSKVITYVNAKQLLTSSGYSVFHPSLLTTFKWYYVDLYDGYISSEDVDAHTPDFKNTDVCQKCPYEILHETMRPIHFVVKKDNVYSYTQPRNKAREGLEMSSSTFGQVNSYHEFAQLNVVGRIRNERGELWLKLSDASYGSLPIPVRDGYAFDGWFTSGASQVTSSTIVNLSGNQELQAHWTKVEPVIQKTEPVVQFVDVPETSFCFDAVQWAVENGVTKGTTATTFSPQTTCSTAHIITFLWRAKGCPEPSISNPFSDLNPESYFAKAAIWAFEKGLVSGNIFNGGKPCTRARTVVFLWILSGKPIEGNSSFSDVPQVADYAYAVAWAVNQNITNGTTETTFSPDRICTRGHIVTFLQRYFA